MIAWFPVNPVKVVKATKTKIEIVALTTFLIKYDCNSAFVSSSRLLNLYTNIN